LEAAERSHRPRVHGRFRVFSDLNAVLAASPFTG
jgi:hypothetical protein